MAVERANPHPMTSLPPRINPRTDLADRHLHAASRKIAIASFHERELNELVAQSQPLPNQAPVEVHAHFEGVLYAYIAAADKVEEAVLSALTDRPKIHKETPAGERFQLRVRALAHPSVAQLLLEWSADPFFADARWVRKKATHAHYEKTPPNDSLTAIGDWLVQTPPSQAAPEPDGAPTSRRLRDYCRKAVEHLLELDMILPGLDQFIASRGRVARAGRDRPEGRA